MNKVQDIVAINVQEVAFVDESDKQHQQGHRQNGQDQNKGQSNGQDEPFDLLKQRQKKQKEKVNSGVSTGPMGELENLFVRIRYIICCHVVF